MGGIIVLAILIPVIFLFLLVTILNRSGEQQRLLESLYDKIKELTGEVASLTKELREQKKERPVIHQEEGKVVPVIPKPVPLSETTKKEEPFVASLTLPELLKGETVNKEQEIRKKENTKPYVPVFISEEKKGNTDIEKFIGENLANKIGITILVLGISFFIKYAIDKNWIHEAGRVIIGLISGGILIGLAHFFRNKYRSFSSVLVGGGLTVFYFSIGFAFHQYQLISQATAFIIMVIISGLGVILSLFYNRQELAILATIGGFITPFLVSTGHENYIALFTYLCILNAGLMVLAWFKRWPAINTIALFFTTVIYGGWLIKRTVFSDEVLPYREALLFASLFYILFIVMNIINSIRLKNKFNAFDFIILLSSNFLYYTAGMIILARWNDGDYQGLFTCLLGGANLGLAMIFYKKKSTDRNFASLLIGLAVTFLSLIAPVQFKGNHITLFWAAEIVVLFWLYLRSKIVLLKVASLIVVLFMIISLVSTWLKVYFADNTIIPVIFNKGFVTTIVSSIALFAYYILLKRDNETTAYKDVSIKTVRRTMLIAAISLAYLSGILEIFYQFNTRNPDVPSAVIYLQAYTYIFVIILLSILKNDIRLPLLKLLLTGFSLGIYIMGLTNTQELSLYLINNSTGIYFMAHWIAAILLIWLLYYLVVFFFQGKNNNWSAYKEIFTWIIAASMLLVLSIEMYQVMWWTNYRNKTDWAWWENLYYKAGLSILWGLCSFTMMWLGMKKDFKPLRIISLTLFTVTISKLFIYDIRNIPPGGKIAAFILLGVLLLAVSFMYQRLKKIIIDNTTEM